MEGNDLDPGPNVYCARSSPFQNPPRGRKEGGKQSAVGRHWALQHAVRASSHSAEGMSVSEKSWPLNSRGKPVALARA